MRWIFWLSLILLIGTEAIEIIFVEQPTEKINEVKKFVEKMKKSRQITLITKIQEILNLHNLIQFKLKADYPKIRFFIGVDATGNTSMSNTHHGIEIDGASGITIGGTTSSSRNIISSNKGGAGSNSSGLYISAGNNTKIYGNYIGLGTDGNTSLGNGNNGIQLLASTGVEVGSSVSGTGNVISASIADAGVRVGNANDVPNASTVTIRGNIMGANSAMSLAIGNKFSCIAVLAGSSATIGGTGANDRNYLYGTTNGTGIHIWKALTGGVSVKGNTIGGSGLGNSDNGITFSCSSGEIIGAVSYTHLTLPTNREV